MVVLRSREIIAPANPKPKHDAKTPPKRRTPEPSTPALVREPSRSRARMETLPGPPQPRRSLRLSASCGDSPAGPRKRRKGNQGERRRGPPRPVPDGGAGNDSSPSSSDSRGVIGEEDGGSGRNQAEEVELCFREQDRVMELEDAHIVGGDRKGKGILELEDAHIVGESSEGVRSGREGRFDWEEKGEGNVVGDDAMLERMVPQELESLLKEEVELGSALSPHVGAEMELEWETNKQSDQQRLDRRRDWRAQRFRDVARRQASQLAHFEQVQEHVNLGGDAREPSVQDEENSVEDWPGPFSTAMKIIRDRANNANIQRRAGILGKGKFGTIVWEPKKGMGGNRSRVLVPSLQDICLSTLAKNAEAIVSLESVPDQLRYRLSSLLCDSRRMSKHFLDLLVQGSPTEIRLKDCSWLAEEDFTKCFQECNTRNLMVLQLDQCGRCIADYTILPTLARSPHILPVLTTLSLAGACRLSDAALKSLVSVTPALRSINLSQCSLLTSVGIDSISKSLGSVLQELYIADCQGIDAMLILPVLNMIEHLEVLSVAGIQTVCDDFVKGFVLARGHNMKELVFSDCIGLTDSSLKEIADTCPGLRSLDLVNLRKLTDAALGYLANGCQEIQTLKLCRNTFSDEGIAAFLETSGGFLQELSLNSVKKVDINTALALAKRGRCLSSLDLSWCRSLTDMAMGLIVDNCLSLRVLKLFGCSQITRTFTDGHSNPDVHIIGLAMSPTLHIRELQRQESVLRYSAV